METAIGMRVRIAVSFKLPAKESLRMGTKIFKSNMASTLPKFDWNEIDKTEILDQNARTVFCWKEI